MCATCASRSMKLRARVTLQRSVSGSRKNASGCYQLALRMASSLVCLLLGGRHLVCQGSSHTEKWTRNSGITSLEEANRKIRSCSFKFMTKTRRDSLRSPIQQEGVTDKRVSSWYAMTQKMTNWPRKTYFPKRSQGTCQSLRGRTSRNHLMTSSIQRCA